MDIDLKQILRAAAPMLGTALGGPFGAVAGKLVAEALGNPDAKPDEIAHALAVATPEQMLQLKQAEQDFQARMASMGFENTQKLAALDVDDRKSARDMQVSQRSFIPAVLSIITVLGFFGLLIGAAAGLVTLTGSDVLMLLLGVLARETASVYAFWLGSSSGSQQKTELLQQQSQGRKPAA